MRRLLAVATAAFAVLLVQPVPAVAGPDLGLCVPDAPRGAVPDTFVLAACVDAGSVTMRNEFGIAVLVTPDGDVGPAGLLAGRTTPAATVARLAPVASTPQDELDDARTPDVLLPGDTVRWPVGPGAAGFTVAPVEPASLPAVSEALRAFLPPAGGTPPADYAAFAALIGEAAAALEDRAVCVEGKNFLEVAACDVLAAAAVGAAARAQLPVNDTSDVLTVLLDRDRWSEWTATDQDVADRRALLRGELRLALPAAPAPPDGAGTPGASSIDPASEPPSPGRRTAGQPVSPGPAIGRPGPAPAPEPVPAAGPVPAAPQGPQQGHSGGPLDRLRDLAEKWLENKASQGGGDRGNDSGHGDNGNNGNGQGNNGRGHDDGHGNGRGHGGHGR